MKKENRDKQLYQLLLTVLSSKYHLLWHFQTMKTVFIFLFQNLNLLYYAQVFFIFRNLGHFILIYQMKLTLYLIVQVDPTNKKEEVPQLKNYVLPSMFDGLAIFTKPHVLQLRFCEWINRSDMKLHPVCPNTKNHPCSLILSPVLVLIPTLPNHQHRKGFREGRIYPFTDAPPQSQSHLHLMFSKYYQKKGMRQSRGDTIKSKCNGSL